MKGRVSISTNVDVDIDLDDIQDEIKEYFCDNDNCLASCNYIDLINYIKELEKELYFNIRPHSLTLKEVVDKLIELV